MSVQPSSDYGALQVIIDDLFEGKPRDYTVKRLDVVIAVESGDLPSDLVEIVGLLPPGAFTRQRLCDQLNSAIVGHAWGQVYGIVE
jgi:hypothetical protein